MAEKCTHPGGVSLSMFGQEVDPCRYIEIERHENVNVIVNRCRVCGHILLEWERTPETKDIIMEVEA